MVGWWEAALHNPTTHPEDGQVIRGCDIATPLGSEGAGL